MASTVPPKRGTQYLFEVSLVSVSDTDTFQSNPTLASGDVTVSKDGGAFSNIAALPSAISSGKVLTVTLSGTEMTADRVAVLFSDAAGDEWQDLLVTIETVTTSQIDDLATATNLATVDSNVDAILSDTGTDGVVIADGAITADKIATDAITAAKIAANTITSSEIADGAIDAGAIASSAITSAKLATGAITADAIAANAITSSEIADGAITAAKLASNAITADKVAADAITSSELAASAAQEIADAILARAVSNVEDTADATSLAALILAAFESDVADATWTIYKTDHTTTFTTKTVTTDTNADPIVGVT